MTALWKRFGKTEIPYTVSGLEEVLAQVTGDKAFAADFFTRYVNGHESFNYKPLLELAGLTLKKPGAGKAWIGQVRYEEGTTTINSNTIIGTPLYEAGLDYEDVIVSLDNRPVFKPGNIDDILSIHKPGDAISIQFKHRGELKTATITLAENPVYRVTTFEQDGITVTSDMMQFRNAWLGTKVK
jgi:predicted metalloprotease with PDZ domain